MSSIVSTAIQVPVGMSTSNDTTTPSTVPAAMRNPNDVRFKEASPDVINNLLASLSAISLSGDSDNYSPLIPDRAASLRSPPPPSRPSSSQRPSAPTSVFSREPSSSSQRLQAGADTSIGEVSITHVAEPPTVKTSRPPSGYSKLTAPKSRKAKTVQNLRSSFASSPTSTSSPPSRQRTEPPLPQLAEEPPLAKTSKSKKSTDEFRRARALSTKSQRDSVQVARSREAKGKQRAGVTFPTPPAFPDSPTSPLYSPLAPQRPLLPRSPYSRSRSPPSQRLFLSEQVSPAPRSPVRNPVAKDDLYTSNPTLRPHYAEGSNDNFVIIHHKKTEPLPSRQDRRKFIPSRSSSVGRTSASPPKFGRSSTRSSRQSSLYSQHHSPETVPEEAGEEEQVAIWGQELQGDVREPRARAGEPNLELSEENSVIKRIKQLRAAKEQRDRANAEVPDNDSNEHAPPRNRRRISLSRLKPSETSNAATQVSKAATLQERRFAGAKLRKQPTLAPPRVSPGPSPSPTRANFSRPRPNEANGTPRSPTTEARPVQPKRPTAQANMPGLSRSASRIKRWSNPDLAATKNPYQRHLRNDSNKTEKAVPTQSPLIEEKRSSFDSVTDSVREFLTSPRLSQRIKPPSDSRVISFSEVGDPHGHAIFCCVGMGTTRYVMAFYGELATTLKLRLITIERPGIGDSAPYSESRSPLYWPDDIRTVCNHLSIQSFSLVAHSAGAIYALATALKMPSRIRGRVHLLSPWIPPSQLHNPTTAGTPAGLPAKFGGLPRSQRFLRYVPTPFLKLGSATYLAGNGKPASPKSTSSRKGSTTNNASTGTSVMTSPRPSMSSKGYSNAPSVLPLPLSSRPSMDKRLGTNPKPPSAPHLEDMVVVPSDHSITAAVLSAGAPTPTQSSLQRHATSLGDAIAWQKKYDAQLTATTWELTTRNANPAVDLLVCLERNGPIGFSYRDVAREIVIHHGSKDSRVPVENVKWLGAQVLQKAEIRILEGEGHGLMANAGVMASVLTEIGKEAEMGKDFGNLGSRSAYNSPMLETGAATF